MRLSAALKLMQALRRRFTSGVVLLFYLATIFGFPLPASGKTIAGPVQACGCQMANQCGHCCSSAGHGSGGCCGNPVAMPANPPKKACCQAKQGATPTQPANTDTEQSSAADSPVQFVLGVSALRCHGLSTHWMTAGGSAPPPLILWNPELNPVALVCNLALSSLQRPIPPLEPPPRSCSIEV
jgi:hypothetical protein